MKELFRVEVLRMRFMDNGWVVAMNGEGPFMHWKIDRCAVWTQGLAGNRLEIWLEARPEVQNAYNAYLASEVLK